MLLVSVAGCRFEPQVAVDARADDAPVFEPVRDCPATYDVTLGARSSRYRFILTANRAWEASDDCNDDQPAFTHLIAFDDMAEVAEAQAQVNLTPGLPGNVAWVGGVQLRMQPDPMTGWLSVTGGALVAGPWSPNEPDDEGSGEGNDEQFVGLEPNRGGMVDYPNNRDHGGLCECDGKPLDAAAAAAIDASRR